MVPGDEDEMVVPGGRPTEYVGPLETGLNDARARAVGAEGGLSVEEDWERKEIHTTSKNCKRDQVDGLHLHLDHCHFLAVVCLYDCETHKKHFIFPGCAGA
jgi:hypothetical protein